MTMEAIERINNSELQSRSGDCLAAFFSQKWDCIRLKSAVAITLFGRDSVLEAVPKAMHRGRVKGHAQGRWF
jgi:hypothetical protein